MKRIGLLLLALASCRDQGTPIDLPTPDVAGYQANVHAIVEARCATLDCHGDMGRPLRLYSETGLRAADDREAPITAEELEANARALLAVDPRPEGRRSFVLTKPLAGTVEHEGKDQWADTTEPQYLCVEGWLQDRLDEPTVADACATAALEVALPPP